MSLENISTRFTEEVLDTIIRKQGGVKLVSWRFGDGFRKGDSFLSEVHRLIVTGIREDESEFDVGMVIKSIPKNVARKKTFRSSDFSRNEGKFYRVILEKFASFQNERSVTDGFTEFASCYATLIDGQNDFIALEDLTLDGYKTADRSNGFDLYHCQQIMAILGKFHAISLAMKDQEPHKFYQMIEVLEETYFAQKFRDWYAPFQKDQIIVARDAITKEYGETMYETKMKEFTGPNYFRTMCNLLSKRGPLSVICHGDCWAPNFLMKYDLNTSKAVETRMIDFQLARYASPATDISFFMYTCTDQDLREKHFEGLVKLYHRSATILLTALGSNAEQVFPYSALQEELKNYARFGVGMAMEALPFCVMDDDETPDLNEMEGYEMWPLNEIFQIYPCESKEGRLRMANTFKHAIDQGFLD